MANPMKFQVGDKVRVTGHTGDYGNHEFKVGDVITIEDVESHSRVYFSDPWWVNEENLEAADAHPNVALNEADGVIRNVRTLLNTDIPALDRLRLIKFYLETAI